MAVRLGASIYVQASEPEAAVLGVGHLWFNTSTNALKVVTVLDPLTWKELGEAGAGGAAWGSITGTLSNQTDVQGALDGKAASNHNHSGVYEPANANIQTHVGSAHAPSNAQKNSDILKAEIEAVLTGEITSHSHAGGGSDPWTYVTVAEDVSHNSNTVFATITGLSFTAAANTNYELHAVLNYTSSATTNGALFSWTGPASPSLAGALVTIANTVTALSGTTLTGDDSGTAPAAAPAATPTINTAVLDGNWRNGANSAALALRVRPEVNGQTIVVKAGSFLRYRSY